MALLDEQDAVGRTGDGIGGADLNTARTAYAFGLADEGDLGHAGIATFRIDWFDGPAGQRGQCLYRFRPARRATIDIRFVGGNRLGIRPTAVIPTAPALGLWQ